MPALVGRESEQAQIAELLAAARRGTSGVLVLEGEPGIGKTALLENTIARAGGFQLLRVQGLQSEVKLPYGGVGQLLRPLESELAELSQTQVDVLAPVLATAGMPTGAFPAGTVPDRFAVGAAVLALLAAVADGAPVLCVIDDVQWLDQLSAEALTFVGYRLLAEGVVMLLSRRSGEGTAALNQLPVLRIDGLSATAAAQLLGIGVTDEVLTSRVRPIVSAANGNPLALLELPRLLSPDELVVMAALDQPLPIGEALLHAYSSSMHELPEQCRRAVLVAAIVDEPDVRSVERALTTAGLALGDLTAAEDAELLTVESARISFRHPLVRSAATYSVPPSWRRWAHGAVSSSLRDSTSANRKFQCAWHLGASALGADEEVASTLEDAAEQAVVVGGHAAAASAYERAAQLSVSDPDRHRRLVRAADHAFSAGLVTKANELIGAAADVSTNDLDTSVAFARTRCRVAWGQGRLAEALTAAVSAAEPLTQSHPLAAAQLFADAVNPAAFMGDYEKARELASRAVKLSEGDPAVTVFAQGAVACLLMFSGDSAQGLGLMLPMLDHAKRLLVERADFRADGARMAYALTFADEFTRAEELFDAVLDDANHAGALSAMSFQLTCKGLIALKRGESRQAASLAYRGLSLANEVYGFLEYGMAQCAIGMIEAHFGRPEACRSAVSIAQDIGKKAGNQALEAVAWEAAGFLEMSLRNMEAAGRLFERSRGLCRQAGLLEMAFFQWGPELSEIYVRRGQPQDALAVVDELDWHAKRTNRPIAKAFAARCRGFAVEVGYESHFEAALRWHDDSERPFELARTQLCYGERLRRDRKRAAARVQLEQAWLTFRSLGAEIWADLARVELEAAGVSITQEESNSQVALLTPQELQVAMAVADGASNREAAAQLFLSPKTIEYHLSRVFRKLEIASRGELSAALGAA
jgi:DNA-binding CsgD family transcriptional regulator